ncbi:hypothetical protein [Nonomuraea sp. NEAU-A123]|uniref:hypothetical protein n=1 Tax=Nonomuraea sp. NEAU-A123 TaxID=2839649 RepID=UPI001BE46104|nr:hypothetical protein [Nonomuraea sp. NEAU-A123]MBT2230887.1 hypothetical protein [Nonomuraea sp. NEAU-A123]
MVRHGWIVAGALAFAGASVVVGIQCEPVAAGVFRAAGAAGMALVFERLGDPADFGKWVRTGDALRFRVSLDGFGRDARLAVATSPARALTSMTCPGLPAATPGGWGAGLGESGLQAGGLQTGGVQAGGVQAGGLQAGGLQVGGRPVGGEPAPDGALAARTSAVNALAGEAAGGQAIDQASTGGQVDRASTGGQVVGGASTGGQATVGAAAGGQAAGQGFGPVGAGPASVGVLASGPSSRMTASVVTAPAATAPGGVGSEVVPQARVCALGDAAGDRSVDVLLTVPQGPREVVLTAAARAREVAGGAATTVVGSTATPVKAPVRAPAKATGRTGASTETLSKGARASVEGLSNKTPTTAEGLSKRTRGEVAARGKSADDRTGTFVEIPRGDLALNGRAVRVRPGTDDAHLAAAGRPSPVNGHPGKSHLRTVSAGRGHASGGAPATVRAQVLPPETHREPALRLPQVASPVTPGTVIGGTPGLATPGSGTAGTSGLGTGGTPRPGTPRLGTQGLGTPGFGAGAATGWGAMTSAEEVGAPLPLAISGNRFHPAERVNPLAGVRGLPWAAGGIAVLLGGLWLVARAQRSRLWRKVF